jgi:spermidine export protein MdtJ
MIFKNTPRNLIAWVTLMAAILCEIASTTLMAEAARHDGYLGYVLMAVALAFSYILLSRSLRYISLGIAYAVWEGMGLVGLTLVSVYVFEEILLTQELVGLGLAVIGLICVTLGETHAEEAAA